MAGSKQARVSPRAGNARASQAYNGAIRSQLGELQRARILSAAFDVAAQREASNMSVAHVVERAGVSRRTFYELFTDREDCFLAAFEQALSYASERVLPAYDAEKGWREQVRAGLIAFLSFLDEEPTIGKLLIVESFGGGAATLARRNQLVALLTSVIEQGRDQAKAGSTIPPLTGEGIIGGALAVIHSRLAGNDGESLVVLTNPLMSMIVLPYLGAGVARKELERPIPVSTIRKEGVPLRSDPFKDAGMRLTYRTVRVLIAIAEHSRASNRTVGEMAGITDQGQISKLLARLERIGLVSNTGLGPGQGAPNAWSLTARGRQVAESITHTHEGKPEGESTR